MLCVKFTATILIQFYSLHIFQIYQIRELDGQQNATQMKLEAVEPAFNYWMEEAENLKDEAENLKDEVKRLKEEAETLKDEAGRLKDEVNILKEEVQTWKDKADRHQQFEVENVLTFSPL